MDLYSLSSLDISLRDLGLDYADIFYSHSPHPNTPLEETVGALASAVRSGKALYIGISNYSHDRAREAARLRDAEGIPLLVHQSRLSIFDQHIDRDGILDAATESGTGTIVYSPLAQGLLTDKYMGGRVPQDSRAADSAFLSAKDITADYVTRVESLNHIAQERGQSLPQLALQWVLRSPEVPSALIGASSVAQLEHNLAATGFTELTADELTRINAHAIDLSPR